MNSRGKLFKADGEENLGAHIDKHIKKYPGEKIDIVVKPVQWWNIFNWRMRWYCKNCKQWI